MTIVSFLCRYQCLKFINYKQCYHQNDTSNDFKSDIACFKTNETLSVLALTLNVRKHDMDLSHKLLTEEIKLDIKYGREMSRTRYSDDSIIQLETKKMLWKFIYSIN